MPRMPVVFVPHGGGPWPFVEMGLPPDDVATLADYLRSVRDVPPDAAARAARRLGALGSAGADGDDVGAPADALRLLRLPARVVHHHVARARRSPALASRVRALLGEAGFDTAADATRGFDHGTFVPLKLTYPEADVPAVQLSLKEGLDPAEHIAIGRALAPLRDEGVFIVGSGMTFHNLRAFRDPRAAPVSEAFDAWLRESRCSTPARATIGWRTGRRRPRRAPRTRARST